MFQRFLDPEDGQLDLSEWLLDRRGFLPMPIIITEPAVGFGGGVALVFISESFREAARAREGVRRPPDSAEHLRGRRIRDRERHARAR